jgi:hypothetical protein
VKSGVQHRFSPKFPVFFPDGGNLGYLTLLPSKLHGIYIAFSLITIVISRISQSGQRTAAVLADRVPSAQEIADWVRAVFDNIDDDHLARRANEY